MDKNQKSEFITYLRNQIAQTDFRLRGYVVDKQGVFYPQRSAYIVFCKYIKDFYAKDIEPRWIVMPGLRGVGKTTLLAQLFLNELRYSDNYKFYLSIDEVVRRFGATLWDVMECYEEILGKRLEKLDKKLFIFLDEIQYDSKWDAALKSFYDRSKKIFILCTGSSAILLRKQLSADSARRAYFEELYPMSFIEYIKLKHKKFPTKGLSEIIRESLINSNSAQDVFNGLVQIKKQVADYWLELDKMEIDYYVKFGTMPFSLVIQEETVIFNQLEQMVQKIIFTDIPQIANFDRETLNKTYALIYAISDSSTVSLTSLSNQLQISKDTLALIFKSLEEAGFLQKIIPYGSHYKQVRKPHKYLFATPSFRLLFLSTKESISAFSIYKGKLLEDVVGFYLRRIIPKYGDIFLTYDSARAGADFIVRRGDRKIAIEVGYGEKGLQQAGYSLERIEGNFGLVVSESDLSLHNNILKVPLSYFLLL